MSFSPLNVCISFVVIQCALGVNIPCPHGTFGDECRNACHCLSGSAFCRSLDGKCTDNKCSFGWIDPPYCQTECPSGTFGLDCSSQCHCQENDKCSNVNGLCSTGVCGYGWGGASCQRALPVLYDPPTVSRVDAGDQVVIQWLEWIPEKTGNGSGSVVGYTISALAQLPNASWHIIHNLSQAGSFLPEIGIDGLDKSPDRVQPELFATLQLTSSPTAEPSSRIPRRYSYRSVSLLPNSAYKFRITLIGQYQDKREPGWPGPATRHWTMITCQLLADPPNIVQIEANDTHLIDVSWQSAASKTVNCASIGGHDVRISFIESSCEPSIVSVSKPSHSVTVDRRYLRCRDISGVAVRAIDNTGKPGRWTSEFPLKPFSSDTQQLPAAVYTATTVLDETAIESSNARIPEATRYPVDISTRKSFLVTPSSSTAVSSSQDLEKVISSVSLKPPMTHPPRHADPIISNLVGKACAIRVLERTENSLLVRLLILDLSNMRITSCCQWNINSSANDHHEGHNDDYTKLFGYRLSSATFYRVSVTVALLVSPQKLSHTYELVLATAPPEPVVLPPPSVIPLDGGMLKVIVNRSTRQRRRREHSVGGLEFVVMIVVEQNVAVLGPSALEGILSKSDATNSANFDARSINNRTDILMNRTRALGSGMTHYVAGVVDADATEFVIGNGSSGPPYENPPLEFNQLYLVWLAAENRIDGISRRTYSRNREPVIAVFMVGYGPFHWVWVTLIVIVSLFVGIVIFLATWLACVRLVRYYSKAELTKAQLRRQNTCVCRMSFPKAMIDDDFAPVIKAAKLSDRARPASFLMMDPHAQPADATGEYCFAEPRAVYESDSSPTTPYRTNPIAVSELRQYCERYLWVNTNQVLVEEFTCLPDQFSSSVGTATRPINSSLNRSSGTVPYDRNRIRLSSAAYINASLVRTIGRRRAVVTQCPTEETISSFWNLVWENRVNRIVALAHLAEITHEVYWPEENDNIRVYGDFKVEKVTVVDQAHYSIRELLVERVGADEEKRRIVQWHYGWWPSVGTDAAVPYHPIDFLDFVRHVRESSCTATAALLVHCVTGGGRSGLFLAVDALVEQGRYAGVVDVLKCVSLLRTERCGLVRSLRQYRFIYECLCEEFDHPVTRISVDKFLLSLTPSTSLLDVEYGRLFAPFYFASARCNHIAADEKPDGGKRSYPLSSSANSLARVFAFARECTGTVKNSSDDDDCHRFSIDLHPAVSADSFIDRNAFVVHQFPNSFEADSFWNVVIENKVTCVVALCSIRDDVSNSESIFPPVDGDPVTVSNHRVDCQATHGHSNASIVVHSLSVSTRHGGGGIHAQQPVHVFEFVSWPSSVDTPSPVCLGRLVEKVRAWRENNSPSRPVMVFGAAEYCVGRRDRSRAAVFCSLWTAIERAERTGYVDVFASTRLVCSLLPSAIISKEQYLVLYESLLEHFHVHRPLRVADHLPEEVTMRVLQPTTVNNFRLLPRSIFSPDGKLSKRSTLRSLDSFSLGNSGNNSNVDSDALDADTESESQLRFSPELAKSSTTSFSQDRQATV